MNDRFKKQIYHFVKNDGLISIFSLFVIILVIFIKNNYDVIDWSIFSALAITMCLSGLNTFIKIFILNRLEDKVKLTTDYELLTKKYTDHFITYDNSNALKENIYCLPDFQQMIYVFPVIQDCELGNYDIEIKDSKKMYVLPKIIQDKYDEIFAIHKTSNNYNQLNIRVDDWKKENDKFVIYTSRTTYYSSLVTNRAIDYKWTNGMTVRECFEYGPFIHPLRDSQLSNHIGVNGFVISSDGYIPFIKRNNHVSIGKNTFGDSIGASIKTKYSLNNNQEFTKTGLVNGILKEIYDELLIPIDCIESFCLEKNIIAAYRDVVEGGKPQLLFVCQSLWEKDKIEGNFKLGIKKRKKNKKKFIYLEDGEKMLWIHQSKLKDLCITPNMLIYNQNIYEMVPSASASIVMLIKYFERNSQNENN